MFAAYLGDQNYAVGQIQLCDFADIESLDADFNSIWSALSMMNASNSLSSKKPKCVIFALGDVAFGYGRMYQSLAEYEDCIQVTVCREEKEAFAVLDLEYPTMQDLREGGGFLAPAPRVTRLKKA